MKWLLRDPGPEADTELATELMQAVASGRLDRTVGFARWRTGGPRPNSLCS